MSIECNPVESEERGARRSTCSASIRFNWLAVVSAAILTLLVALWVSFESGRGTTRQRQVVVYAAQDQVYAEPIFRQFERESGMRVRAVFDSEAVKTVGLANRLLSERDYPHCDLFWGNEEMRVHQLASLGVWRETNGWRAFGHRSRRIVVNTNLVLQPDYPDSLMMLTNARWRGRVAIAYPMFGTTATHFLALREHWGEARWLEWCRALRANEPFLVEGNSVVARLVARGEAAVGLTDSDDIAAELRSGAPVRALSIGTESLLIPNTFSGMREPK